MSISLIINTCAGREPRADVCSHGGQPYEQRAYALQNFILPAYIADPDVDEVIVVGEWMDGPGYTYVPSSSIYYSSDDAVHQRQAGFEAAKGDWLVFQHDDHLLENEWWGDDEPNGSSELDYLFNQPGEVGCDILVPQRWTRLRNITGEKLPNGESSYISGHCAIYRREVLERCPWNRVAVCRTWDMFHSEQIRNEGFNIHWSQTLRVWDVEAGSHPWT